MGSRQRDLTRMTQVQRANRTHPKGGNKFFRIERCPEWPLWETATEYERVRYIQSFYPARRVVGDGNGVVIVL